MLQLTQVQWHTQCFDYTCETHLVKRLRVGKNATLWEKNPHYNNDRVVSQDLITCTFRRKHFRFFVTSTSGDFLTFPKQLHSRFGIPSYVTQICEVAYGDLGTLQHFQFHLKKCATILQSIDLRRKVVMNGEARLFWYSKQLRECL